MWRFEEQVLSVFCSGFVSCPVLASSLFSSPLFSHVPSAPRLLVYQLFHLLTLISSLLLHRSELIHSILSLLSPVSNVPFSLPPS